MATTTHDLPAIEGRDQRFHGSGNAHGGGRGSQGRLPSVQDFAPPPTSTGVWVLLAAISMTFAALTSAMIVRKGGSLDWEHFTLPSILYLNTVILLASSVTLEVARRRVAAFMSAHDKAANPALWLSITLALGLLFVAGQYVAWHQLRAQGLYLASNPSSSFFYVFTAAHALHVLGGLAGLMRVMAKLRNRSLRRTTLIATARYWHFMGALWMYLLVLLWVKL